MCPEVEKRLKELKERREEKKVYVSRGISRRDVLKTGAVLSLLPFFPSLSFSSATDVFTGLLLAGDCAYCKLKGLCCRKKKFGVCVKWGLKWKYRIPVGFLEANHTCSFLIDLIPIVGSAVNSLLQTICQAVPPPFLIQSKLGRMNVGSDFTRSYMRVHTRWYSIPSALKPILEAIYSVKLLCPCFDLKIVDHLPVVGTYKKFIDQMEKKIKEIEEKTGVKQLKERLNKLRETVEKLKDVTSQIPVFFTEPLSLFWLTETFNPDFYLLGSLQGALVQAIGSFGMATCPYILDRVKKLGVELPAGVDPSFICVGHWGLGYPRFGIVRNDNPLVAELLALARFHHLFSKTVPLIDPAYNPSIQDWQIIHPRTTGCFRIGYYGMLDLYDITDLSGGELTSKLSSLIAEQMSAMVNAVTDGWRRGAVVVVWERRNKCCGI